MKELNSKQKVVVIDDLISTGQSVLGAAKAVQTAGAQVLGIAGIFSYQLQSAKKNFTDAGLSFQTVTNYTTLIEVAKTEKFVDASELEVLRKWRQ